MVSKLKSNKKNIQENIYNLKLSVIDEIIEVLAFIDGKGKMDLASLPASTNYKSITEFIKQGSNKNIKDFSRRIKTAIQFIKSYDKNISVKSSRNGLYFENLDKDWKKKESYQTLCLLCLISMAYNQELNLEIFDQLNNFNSPLLNLILWKRAIKSKVPLSITYFSDRRQVLDEYNIFIPQKLYFKDGHWRVIGFDGMNFRSVPIHSIEKIQYSNTPINTPIPEFKWEEIKSGMFGPGFQWDREPTEIKIFVPQNIKKAIQKRKPIGKWKTTKDGYFWLVNTYYPEEVYDYVFRWKGLIKIIEPEHIVEEFKTICKKFL